MHVEELIAIKVIKPFELILNVDKYREEKNKQSLLYKKLADLKLAYWY